MKTQFYVQLLFSLVITGALAYVTFYEWRKQEFWGFEDPEAKLLQVQFKERVPHAPKSFGEWVFVKEMETDVRELKQAQVDASLSWIYKNLKTNDHVKIFFCSGPTNHIAVHTPDQCYPGHGSKAETERFPVRIVTADQRRWGEFNHQTFSFHQNDVKIFSEVWWGFNDGINKAWRAPGEARTEFPNQKALYKLYVSRDVSEDDRSKSSDNAVQMRFLKAFLPALDAVIFPEEKKPEKASADKSTDPSAVPAADSALAPAQTAD